MAGVNKVILVGNLGRDPEARTMGNGGNKVVSFSVATSETWKDKNGERAEKTQWHRIAIFNEKLGEIAEKYLKKGSKVYLEGAIETRKYKDKDGNEKETTEIVLGRFKGELTLLDGASGGGQSNGGGERSSSNRGSGGGGGGWDKPKGNSRDGDLDDSIPFNNDPAWQQREISVV